MAAPKLFHKHTYSETRLPVSEPFPAWERGKKEGKSGRFSGGASPRDGRHRQEGGDVVIFCQSNRHRERMTSGETAHPNVAEAI